MMLVMSSPKPSAPLANVELCSAAARVGEFILAQAELLHVGADVRRHARAGRQKMKSRACKLRAPSKSSRGSRNRRRDS